MAIEQPVSGKAAVSSKINWTQILLIGASVSAYVANQINAKATIGAIIFGSATLIWRNFFSGMQVTSLFKK